MYTKKEEIMTFLIYTTCPENVLVGYDMVKLVLPQEKMQMRLGRKKFVICRGPKEEVGMPCRTGGEALAIGQEAEAGGRQ